MAEPSKDLRLLDETLERVIIVDDNPLRLFQFDNVRSFKMFDADAWCAVRGGSDLADDAAVRAMFDQALTVVGDEIEESLRWSRRHGAPFAHAYLPYADKGRLAVDALVAAGLSRADAIALVRESRSLARAKF